MRKERRSLHGGEMRAVEMDGEHYVNLRVVQYNVVDDYGSLWSSGCFDRSLTERMPTLAWAHNWGDPIGRGSESQGDSQGPSISFRLDDFEAVPRARQAFAQVNSGTIDDCSVGFSNVTRRPPSDSERKLYPGVQEIILDADLDEVSLVLRGAVPGAKVLALRSTQLIDAEVAGQIMARFASGELDLLEALTAVKESSVEDTEPVVPKEEPKPDEETDPVPADLETNPPIEVEALTDKEIEEALASLSRLD